MNNGLHRKGFDQFSMILGVRLI